MFLGFFPKRLTIAIHLLLGYNSPVMKSFAFKFPVVSHQGNLVSHAKNRSKRGFKYNLHTVTVLVDGLKKRLKVPARMIRVLKKAGVTTHFKKAAAV